MNLTPDVKKSARIAQNIAGLQQCLWTSHLQCWIYINLHITY